jgi:hypothetical protein
VAKTSDLRLTIETAFKKTGLRMPNFATKNLQLVPSENALEYLRSEIQSCQMSQKEK